MQNPHEEKHKVLLQRINGSLFRLGEVVKDINYQLEQTDAIREQVGLACQVWTGYESKVQSYAENAAVPPVPPAPSRMKLPSHGRSKFSRNDR